MDQLPRVLTVGEAAAALRVNRRTVLRLLKTGKLHGTKVGHNWRIPLEALHEVLRSEGENGGKDQ